MIKLLLQILIMKKCIPWSFMDVSCISEMLWASIVEAFRLSGAENNQWNIIFNFIVVVFC